MSIVLDTTEGGAGYMLVGPTQAVAQKKNWLKNQTENDLRRAFWGAKMQAVS